MIEFLGVTVISLKGVETPTLVNVAAIVTIEYAAIPRMPKGERVEGCRIILADGTRLIVKETSEELFANGVELALGMEI